MKKYNELTVGAVIVIIAIGFGIVIQLWNPEISGPTGYAGGEAPIEELTPIHDGYIHRGTAGYSLVDGRIYLSVRYSFEGEIYGAQSFLRFDLTGKSGFSEAKLYLKKRDGPTAPCPTLYKIDDYLADGQFNGSDFSPFSGTEISDIPCNDYTYKSIDVTSHIVPDTINAFSIFHKTKEIPFSYNSSESSDTPYLELIYPPAPNTPAGFTANSGQNPGEIKLNWNELAEATYYELDWWATDPNQTTTITDITSSEIPYYFSVPQAPEENALEYNFMLRACNGGGCSPNSSSVSSYPKLGAKANGDYEITIEENFLLNGEAVYAAGTPTFLWEEILDNAYCSLINANQANPAINCSQLGQAQLRLTVNSANGTAQDTAIVNVVENPPSNPPSFLNVGTGSNAGEFNLDWEEVSGITHYEIDWWTTGEKTTISNVSSNTLVFSSQQAPLDQALEHNFVVRACNSGGCSTDSVIRLGYPKIGSAFAGGPYSASLSGALVDIQLNGSVQYSSNPVFNWSITGSANCSPPNPTGKNPIVSCYAIGTSNAVLSVTGSDAQTATSSPTTINITKAAPGIPQNLNAVTGTNVGEIIVSWDAVVNADHYILKWNPGAVTQKVSGASFIHLTTESAGAGQEYSYEVRACDDSNPPLCSDYSVSDSAYPKLGAYANGPYQVVKGAENSVELNGSALFEIGVVTFAWSISDSAGTPNCTPTSSSLPNPEISCGNTGIALAILTVTAANGTATSSSTIESVNTPDLIPPTINLTQPNDGATLSETATLSATATDNVAVRNVEFYLVAGNSIAIVDSSPYTFEWNTTLIANGTYSLSAAATDTSGNKTELASPINITINNEALPECTSGDTRDCTTSDSCPGKETCVSGSWNGVCTDTANDNCPAINVECSEDIDCYSTHTRERCDTTNKKHYNRSVTCVSQNCSTGSWVDSGQYCNECTHCGDGELNCSETCSTCPTETGCGDTDPPAKPTGLEIHETKETSITVRWNANTENDLKRYTVYYGKSSGSYSSQSSATKEEVELEITDLDKATKYYIAIKAIDVTGNKSDYSTEVSTTTKGTPSPDCSEDNYCNTACTTDPDCECIEDDYCDEDCDDDPDCEIECGEDGECNEDCESDPDCEEDNTLYWGIGTAIIAISAALAYIFFTVEG